MVAAMSCVEKVLNHPSLRIELSQGEDGYVVAECLDISGCMSQGATREEALENIVDAISACLDVITGDVSAKLKLATAVRSDSNCYRLSLTTSELSPA